MGMSRAVREITREAGSADGFGRRRGGAPVPNATQADATHRVNVNFSGEAYEALTQLSKAKGKSMSDVLRDAIVLDQWLEEARREGGRVLVERNGKTRELVLR